MKNNNSQQLRYQTKPSQKKNPSIYSGLKSPQKQQVKVYDYQSDQIESQGPNTFPLQGSYQFSNFQEKNLENLRRMYGQKSHILNNLRVQRDGLKQTQNFYDGQRNVKIRLSALNEKAKGQTQIKDLSRRLNEDRERKVNYISDVEAYQSQVQRHIDYITHRKEEKNWSMNGQMQLRVKNLQEQLRYMTKKLQEQKTRHAREQKLYIDRVLEMRIDLKQKEQKLKKLNSDLFSLYKQNNKEKDGYDKQCKQIRQYNQDQHIIISQRNLNLNGFQQKFIGAIKLRQYGNQIIDRVQKNQTLAIFKCQSSSKFINGFQCIYNTGKEGKQHFSTIQNQWLRINARANTQGNNYQNYYGVNFTFDQIELKDVLSIKIFYKHKIVGMLFDVRGGHEQHRRNFQIPVGDCNPYNDCELVNLAGKRKKIVTISSHWQKGNMIGISIFFKYTQDHAAYRDRQKLAGRIKSQQKEDVNQRYSSSRSQDKFRQQFKYSTKGQSTKGNVKRANDIADSPQVPKDLLKLTMQSENYQYLPKEEQIAQDSSIQTTDQDAKLEYMKMRKKLQQNNPHKILQEVDFFVLDNSIRQSTVGTMRGHTIQNKMNILDHLLQCRFSHIIVAAFQHKPRVDDQFVKQLIQKRGQQIRNKNISLYGFTQLISTITDGVMIADTKPIALQKMEMLGINNPIFEIDLADKRVNWDKFKIEDLCELTLKWIRWAKFNMKKNGKQPNIAINLRDFPLAMIDSRVNLKVLQYVGFLSSLQPKDKIFAILIEDATGRFIPRQLGAWIRATKNMMNAKGWKKGKLLVHIHQKWGLAGETQLDCIINGADGVWASVCEQGAALGHASSTVTIMNLVRFNNQKVIKTYNCSNLRKASRQVTKITTGQYPHSRQPIVGERALDLVFDFAGIAGGLDTQQFQLQKFFGEERPLRITTMASTRRIVQKLQKLFGKDQNKFNQQVAESMRAKMVEQLDAEDKLEYDSPLGLIMLYSHSGGHMDDQMNNNLEQLSALQKQSQKKYLPILNDVKQIWDRWNRQQNIHNQEDSLQYDSFYHAFLQRFFGCFRCEHTFKALKAIDMNKDGNVDWKQFKVYLIWAMKQFPDQIQTAEQCIQMAVKKGIIPDMQDVIVAGLAFNNQFMPKNSQNGNKSTEKPADKPDQKLSKKPFGKLSDEKINHLKLVYQKYKSLSNIFQV